MGNSRYEFMQKFFDIKKQGPKERLKKACSKLYNSIDIEDMFLLQCFTNYTKIFLVFQDVERLEDVRPIDDLLQYINAKDGGNILYLPPFLFNSMFIIYSMILLTLKSS
jgi:hypothetical protein